MHIFQVEFFGKVTFSSPCIVEKWHFGINSIEKSDVLALSPLTELVSCYRKIYLQKFKFNLLIIKQ